MEGLLFFINLKSELDKIDGYRCAPPVLPFYFFDLTSNLKLGTLNLQRSRRRFPFIHVHFPTFGLGQIQRVAFRIAETEFRIGARGWARRDFQYAAQFRHYRLHLVGQKADMVDAVFRLVAFDLAVERVNRQVGHGVAAKAVAAALLPALLTPPHLPPS